MSEPAQAPLVVAVVLTWNDTELTTNCLRSVFESDYPNLRVVLVDNGSTPPCGPQLKDAFPGVELLQLPENLGFSGGANRGLERALEMNPGFVHLIGNDSTLAPDCISQLVRAAQAHPKAGAISPLLLNPGDAKVVQFYTADLDREAARHVHHHVNTPWEARQWPTVESEFIPCVAIMFRAETLREVGLFDESFGTCVEDVDLCVRIHDAGWTYLMAAQAEAVHVGSYTTGKTSPYIVYYATRNRLTCIRRYADPGVWRRRGLFILRTFWWQARNYGLGNWACHRAFARGVLDFLRSVSGERGSATLRP